jgi:4-oxalocrotonate tautomerase
MPVLEFHLTAGAHRDDDVAELLLAASKLYADALASPIERVRVYVTMHAPQHVAVGGQLLSEGGSNAPYFHFLVLEGRPIDQCQALITGFTDLLERTLKVDRRLVRGGCWPIPPQFWGIGGTPASALRAAEIQARAAIVATGATAANATTASPQQA